MEPALRLLPDLDSPEVPLRRILLLPLLLLAGLHGVVAGQVISGTVIDSNTSRPVAGAIVDVAVRDVILARARTDSAGMFLVAVRRAGNVVIRVDHASYASIDSLAIDLQPGETIVVELRIGRTAVPLQPLIVTARTETRLAGFEERRRRGDGFGQFITRRDIEGRSSGRTTDLFRSLRGVEITTVGRGGANTPTLPGTPDVSMPRVSLITMRTPSGPCVPAVFVDGMEVRQFEDSGIDDIVKPDMLEGVEVYPGSTGAPAEFIDSSMCGVVAFWTRPALDGGWSWTRMAAGVAGFLVMVMITR